MQHKKFAKKRKMEASAINSTVPAHFPTTSQHVVSDISNTTGLGTTVGADRKQDTRIEGQLAGYIFMCNAKTKRDCFIYRVFGLPASRMYIVEKIKPNAKLFLFDFDLKLLYGPYVADSVGQLALEPYAFEGRFPAQVKFSIANDCLPLPEVAFRDAIKENYLTVSKFKQDLNSEQVAKLVSLFRPIILRSPQQVSLVYPGHRLVPETPLPSLQSSYEQRSLSRGGEFASNHPYQSHIAYDRYGSAPSSQSYHPPNDPVFQQHDVRLRHGYTTSQAINPIVPPSPPGDSYYHRKKMLIDAAHPPQTQVNTTYMENAPNYTQPSYSYQTQGYPGTHTAAVVPTEQPVNAYERHLTSSSSLYTQSERPQLGTSEVGVVGASSYPYYGSTNSTEFSYGHAYQPYSRSIQQQYPSPQVSVPEGTLDPNATSMYSNSSTTGYGYHPNQGYTGYYQATSITNELGTTALPATAYAQSQGIPGLVQTVPSGSGVVGNAHSYYNQAYQGY